MAYSPNLGTDLWTLKDVTPFSVEAWEPAHDTELWKNNKQLHLYVQRALQGDGEKTEEAEDQTVYVLEIYE